MKSSEIDNEEEIHKSKDHFYMENGLMVMTEQYHLDRGYCCGSRCRHCPYEHKYVPKSDD